MIAYILASLLVSTAVDAHDSFEIDQPLLAEIPELREALISPVAAVSPISLSQAASTVDAETQESSDDFSVPVDKVIGTAVDVAMKQSKTVDIDKIVESVQTNLDALAPQSVEWPGAASHHATFFALAPAPSQADVKFLEKQVTDAEKYVKRVKADIKNEAEIKKKEGPKCAGCKKYYDRKYAEEELPPQKKKEAEAEKKLKDAEAWAALEQKREDELPELVKSLQMEADKLHDVTVKAEKKALETKISRIALEHINDAKLADQQKVFEKQRFIEELRAAEDAKVSGCALKAALEKDRKLKVKKMQAAQVEETISKPVGSLRLRVPSSSL